MSNNWVSYINGNYTVSINLDNGTKIRENDLDNLTPDFPENIDIKITGYCDLNPTCKYCHENSGPNGKHGDILNLAFIDTLSPYTELAIGGGNPISHPDFERFLGKLYHKKIIANVTVNQKHFLDKYHELKYFIDLGWIKGLGVSVVNPTPEFIEKVKTLKNVVLHVINGVITIEDFKKLYDNNLKVLILGYKMFRRGITFYSQEVENNKGKLFEELPELIKHFKVVSFDNLAITQLECKRLMSEEKWNEFYMGDDGKYTMYIDAVEQLYASSSVSTNRKSLLPNIVDMFNDVRSQKENVCPTLNHDIPEAHSKGIMLDTKTIHDALVKGCERSNAQLNQVRSEK